MESKLELQLMKEDELFENMKTELISKYKAIKGPLGVVLISIWK